MDEEIEHARRGQRGEVLIGEVAVQLEDPATVTLATALGETFELDEAEVVLIPLLRGDFPVSRCVFFSWRADVANIAAPFQLHKPPNATKGSRRIAALFNRVGTGIEPAPPTPPGMRIRTGRFQFVTC